MVFVNARLYVSGEFWRGWREVFCDLFGVAAMLACGDLVRDAPTAEIVDEARESGEIRGTHKIHLMQSISNSRYLFEV